jgi:hypothetical protein
MVMSTKEMQATVAELGDARRLDQAEPPTAASRNAGLDALRASLTLLVVFHHAAIPYGGEGSWFYVEIKPSGAPSSIILTLFSAYNQAFFMGLFFLIAGSLTPPAIARHGAARFLRERMIRLGLPLAVYRNFRAEYDRLQRERVAAFQEFRADVERRAFPEDKHLVPIADAEFEAFMNGLEKR